jgi:hypothetical protein
LTGGVSELKWFFSGFDGSKNKFNKTSAGFPVKFLENTRKNEEIFPSMELNGNSLELEMGATPHSHCDTARGRAAWWKQHPLFSQRILAAVQPLRPSESRASRRIALQSAIAYLA